MKTLPLATFTAPAILLSSCSTSTNPSPTNSGADWHDFVGSTYNGLSSSSSLGPTSIPVLGSPSYEANWGKPKVRKSAAGIYELNYANPNQPFDRLVIFGSPKPFPALKSPPFFSKDEMVNGELTAVDYPQSFRTTTIAGKSVRWFQESSSGGADGAYYSTVGFSVTDSSGKTGYYRLVVEGGDNMDAEVARRFSSVTPAN